MLTSWLEIPADSDFSIYNLPFGVFSTTTGTGSHSTDARCATILGDTVIDLSVLEEAGLFADIPGLHCNVFCQPTLNAFIEHPKPVWLSVRQRLIELFSDNQNDAVKNNSNLQNAAFYPLRSSSGVTLHLPVQVGDYTDFYSSREHATNVGTMFRGKDHALQPNWLHLPVGYHGRASTVCVTGTPVRRPCGQLQKDPADDTLGSIHAPCRQLDFELEVAAVVGGPPNALGGDRPMTLQQAKDRIFGLLLMNDWSARDVQKWEYVPLGPFTAKNFATTVSPWIVMVEALTLAPTSAGIYGQSDPVPLPYLRDPDYASYDIALTVAIQCGGSGDPAAAAPREPHTVSASNFRNLYWNSAQQLVHHAVTGCVMKAGDLLGSGTISGSSDASFGSMLELSWKGSKEVPVGDQVRKFLQDGDTVIMKGVCVKSDVANGGARVGFGECSGTILPAFDINTDAVLATTEEEEEAPPPMPIRQVNNNDSERYRDFTLYGYWRSSSTWRVRVALAAKSIDYTTVPINLLELEHKTDAYLAKNPHGQVPLLEFTDTATGCRVRLAQSLAIINFLEKVYPQRRSLIPRDPLVAAAAYEIIEIINSGAQPLQNVFFLGELEKQSEGKIKAQEVAKSVNEKCLKVVEELVVKQRRSRDPSSTNTAGPYCMGSFSPTLVDACVVPQLYNARRFGVDVDAACPTLVEIESVCAIHPWFQVSQPKVQPDAKEE